jgi:hypothetical protein
MQLTVTSFDGFVIGSAIFLRTLSSELRLRIFFWVNLGRVLIITPSCPGIVLQYVVRALYVWGVEISIEYSFPSHCI